MNSKGNVGEKWLKTLVDSIQSISHGSVEVIIQDSRVIQINRIEKMRLDKREARDDSPGGRTADWKTRGSG